MVPFSDSHNSSPSEEQEFNGHRYTAIKLQGVTPWFCVRTYEKRRSLGISTLRFFRRRLAYLPKFTESVCNLKLTAYIWSFLMHSLNLSTLEISQFFFFLNSQTTKTKPAWNTGFSLAEMQLKQHESTFPFDCYLLKDKVNDSFILTQSWHSIHTLRILME